MITACLTRVANYADYQSYDSDDKYDRMIEVETNTEAEATLKAEAFWAVAWRDHNVFVRLSISNADVQVCESLKHAILAT